MTDLGWTDNCDGTGTVTGTDVSDGASNPETITRTWAYTDAAGNTASTSQTITVNDITDPTITAPADVTVSADAGSCEATVVALGSPTTADNCGVAGTTNDAPGTFPLGTTTVTWTVTDNAGNIATATQTVTVEDNELPLITTCATDKTQSADVSGNSTVPDLTGEIVASDNCTATLTVTQSPIAGTTIGLGVTAVTITVADDNGNSETCSADINVVDDSSPVITTCAADRTQSTDVNCESTVPDMTGEIIASDNGSIASITQSPTAGTVIGVGTTTVTFTVTDDAGNSVTCSADITVVDDIAPTFAAAPSDVTVECTGDVPAMTDLTWTDNCDGTGTVTGTDVSDGASNPETITRTWT